MVDAVEFPSAQRSLVGRHVKVCRHAECLWLEVKSVRPSGNLVAILDNNPREWPESIGDAVEIHPNEIVRVFKEKGPVARCVPALD